MQQPPVVQQPAGAREPEVIFAITENQMASFFLTVISILLAIVMAYLFIQFRTEYKLAQLAQLSPSPSPFLKLKSSSVGASSQPSRPRSRPQRPPSTKYDEGKVPDPETLPSSASKTAYIRPTRPEPNKSPPYGEGNQEAEEKARGVDPEYEQYAQQLQQVLGNLKEAVQKIDESANITEIAGLVKMKPNTKEESDVKIEEDHKTVLEEEDDEDRNTFIYLFILLNHVRIFTKYTDDLSHA